MSLISSLLEEMGTGTGATFAYGSGEQVATPFAFRAASKRVKRSIKESDLSISYTPEKRVELYEKYLKAFPDYKSKVERYVNIFEAYDIKGIMDDITKAEQFAKVGEKLESELMKIDDTLTTIREEYYDEGEKELSDKAGDLSGSYWKIRKSVDQIYQAMEDITALISKIKDKLEDTN
jgi:hypothetical protein